MQGQICQINPYTNIDLLLKSIYRDKQVIGWNAWGMRALTSDLELSIQKTGDTYSVHAYNLSGRSLVILSSHFYFTNKWAEILPIRFSFSDDRSNMLLSYQDEVDFEIMPNTIPKETFYLNYACENYRLIFSEYT